MTAPGDRLLLAAPDAQSQAPVSISDAVGTLGPCTARVQQKSNVVSLNLITTFPEANYQRPAPKADLGNVVLGLVPPGGATPIPISGPFAYDELSYELTAGVVDVPYDPGLVSPGNLVDGTLVMLAEKNAKGSLFTILTEANSKITIASDDRGVYCEVGDDDAIAILVRDRDRPPRTNVTVWLWEYQFVTSPSGFQQRASATLTLVDACPALEHRICFARSVVFPAGQCQPLPIPFRALRPGALALAFTLDGAPLKGVYPWDLAYYAGVRVMPCDDFSNVAPDLRVSWDFIYDKVFRFYNVIYPAMSQHIPFDNQAAMENAAQYIVAITDPKLWSSTRYMPITRDLSSGKRDLIVEWAAAVAAKP